mgnify:CR=1 FL=1
MGPTRYGRISQHLHLLKAHFEVIRENLLSPRPMSEQSSKLLLDLQMKADFIKCQLAQVATSNAETRTKLEGLERSMSELHTLEELVRTSASRIPQSTLAQMLHAIELKREFLACTLEPYVVKSDRTAVPAANTRRLKVDLIRPMLDIVDSSGAISQTLVKRLSSLTTGRNGGADPKAGRCSDEVRVSER